MEQIREVALKAAREASGLLKERFGKQQIVSYKGDIDPVTETDKRSEALIARLILDAFPDHSLLSEEGKEAEGSSAYRWIVDPLDGTTNFLHGFPFFSVSIAVEHQKELVYGVVYDPLREELFEAHRGEGAFLNGQKIRVSQVGDLSRSLLATGFPYDVKKGREDNIVHFINFLKVAQAVRRPGSACLDLCYVAVGRLDGFWELKLQPWDTAAGSLIVKEAGGVVSDFKGGPHDIFSDEIVASNGLIHEAMLKVLASS